MHSEISRIRQQADADITAVASSQQLEDFRIRYLARKGLIASLFDQLKSVPPAQKPEVGKLLNELRQYVQALFDQKTAALTTKPAVITSVDPTLPGRRRYRGTKHLLTQTIEEIESIFVSMGFGIVEGPEIEDDYHNFEAHGFPR